MPAFVLSLTANISEISSGFFFLIPTSTKVPTTVRTIYFRNALASIQKTSVEPSLFHPQPLTSRTA